MARAPRPGGCNQGLEPLLGAERCAVLQTVLIRRGVAWACEAAGADGHAVLAVDRPDAVEGLRDLVPAVEVWDEADPAAAAAAAHDRFGGPLLIGTTDTPRLGAGHASAALVDLGEGADLVVGPAHDGGWYLMAMHTPMPRILGAATVAECLRAAMEDGLEVGLLRMERDLATPADAAALLADPLVPTDVRRALGG